MRILFTNDDGFDAPGLHAVADLFKSEHEIAVVAPDVQRSGASHSLSLRLPFTCSEVGGYDYPVYAVGGTPTDCAKLAMMQLFKDPDVVISGINDGRNLGSDIMYSGTVGAAFEAAYYDKRGIAASLNMHTPTVADFKRCALFIKNNFDLLVSAELPPRTIININFPAGEPLGVKVAKMSLSRAFGDTYVPTDGALKYKGNRGVDPDAGSDEQLCMSGYITVTPLTMDQTDYATLKKIKRDKFRL